MSSPLSCATDAGGVFIAIGKIHFRRAQTRIAVVQLLAQHPLILSNRRLAVAALLRQSASVSA